MKQVAKTSKQQTLDLAEVEEKWAASQHQTAAEGVPVGGRRKKTLKFAVKELHAYSTSGKHHWGSGRSLRYLELNAELKYQEAVSYTKALALA